MNEAGTRAEIIDPNLKSGGWGWRQIPGLCANSTLPTGASKQAVSAPNH